MDKVVMVSDGKVRGVWRDDLWSFSGIPYAHSPEGPFRWQPPHSAEPWDGVRDATAFGPIAPQPAAVAGVTSPADPGADEVQSENCLFLNVWTPEVPEEAPRAPGSGRPVMVWIHGGGFTSGSGSVFLYRGGDLVRNGDVVVVTINYRLGALGFLGHRGLANEDRLIGNWGLHDQVAALQWVHDNIRQFGGDADNVTIFGESAGGFSIAALLGVPSAAGLFRRAVIQSGGAHVHTVEQAEGAADRLVAALGLATCDRSSLADVPAADLVAATEVIAKDRPAPGVLPLPFLPVCDGTFLPQHPLTAVTGGSAAGVDLIIGTNRDEMTLFTLGNPALHALDMTGVHRWLVNSAPDVSADELLETYRDVRQGRSEGVDAQDLLVAIGTDCVFRWPSLQLAAAQSAQGGRTFVYLFDWESPAFGGILGSCHALELPFVFGATPVPAVQLFSGAGPDVEVLSAAMQKAWLTFAATGSPSGRDDAGWPAWDQWSRSTMIFGARTRVELAPRDAELVPWEKQRPLASASTM
jgi:para-nitrobenzyl esterase